MRASNLPKLLTLVLLTAAFGCSDPAADAPQAEVQEAATEIPAEEPSPESTEHALAGTIGFVGSKITGSHEGGFESFEGTASITGGTPEGSSISVTIDTTTLWADNDRLAGHLKSDDFFAVETFPTASFNSTEVAATEDGGYTLTGNLELHGVTKQISFPADIQISEAGFTATAEFAIKRFDFGLEYPGKKDDLIRDDVLIKLDLASAMGDDSDSMESAGDEEGMGEETTEATTE